MREGEGEGRGGEGEGGRGEGRVREGGRERVREEEGRYLIEVSITGHSHPLGAGRSSGQPIHGPHWPPGEEHTLTIHTHLC